jgi:TolB-like protein/Tfp pilus assembly protein PilF
MPPGPVRFADFELDPERYELRRNGAAVRLERIPMDMLLHLVAHSGKLVTRQDLIDRAWGKNHFFAEDDSVNTAVRKLRAALGDNPRQPQFIETVTGKGYRFVAKIHDSPRPRRMLLAVLPFDNLSPDPADVYLSEGVTDELITHLGALVTPRLGVIAGTTAAECRRRGMTIDQIGRELKAQCIVEGAVKKTAERVRINVRLVQISDQSQLWAKSYERTTSDLLEWQWDVAREIASEVHASVPGVTISPRARGRRVEPEAHENYLCGMHHFNRRTPAGYVEAIALFEKAIGFDPVCALAYTGLADAFILLAIHGVRPPSDAYPRARASAMKALEIDPMIAEAHTVVAEVQKGFDRNWSEAENGYRAAILLNHNYGLCHGWYANLLSILERHEEAVAEAEEARYLDPLSPSAAGFVAFTLYRARRFEHALAEADKALDLNPKFPVVNWFSCLIQIELGNLRRARELAAAAVAESRETAMYLATLALILGRDGEPAAAAEIAAKLELRSAGMYVSPFDLFLANLGAGKKDAAFRWLKKSVDDRVMRVTELGMPLFDPLRADPRFIEIIAKTGIPR